MHLEQPGDPGGEQQEQPGIPTGDLHRVPALPEEDRCVPQDMDDDQRQHAARAQEQPDKYRRPESDPDDA